MKLQTQVPIAKSTSQIDYQSRLVLLGSCFVENIGDRLGYHKFEIVQNPFGILFHPEAIEKLVLRAINSKLYTEEEIFFHNERWHCFEVHSDLSDYSQQALLQRLNEGLELTRQQIITASHIVITLGTSWTYRHLQRNILVANCHKVPQKEFSKELLSTKRIIKCLESTIETIRSVNDKVAIVFTVSPVRHLKDGFTENQLSKGHLFAALPPILERRHVCYFPAYEIMMDELRDYRFYQADMVHPNQLAIDYIWERFKLSWISEHAYPVMEKVDEIQKGLRHIPFNEKSQQHRKFVKSLRDKITYLQKEHPFMEFDKPETRN